ncbi:hypothetical protein OH77DRAFT_1389509 [Trametes cingulata]|nr:hypothetical protein OH77DRAFT_1389509 [Trametes cingulata]
MSLPSRPNVGLPSTPRARSFTAGPARQDIPPRPRSSASERPPPPSSYNVPPLPTQARALRTQRSLNTLPSAPSGSIRSRSLDRRAESRHTPSRSDPPPPLPGLPTSRRIARNPTSDRDNYVGHTPARSVDNYTHRTSEDVLSDSSSSSGGSYVMSPTSISSSRTSLDDGDGEEKKSGKPGAGHGASLWTSITSVASNLTISVSKAWSSNLPTYSGEETPVGGESRLTRAMKAYHIEKARDPSDLPDWLFDERERGVRPRQTAAKPSTSTEEREERAPTPPRDRPELARSATTRRPEEAPAQPPRIARGPTLADRRAGAGDMSGAGSEEHVTKSMARLRALRDAKRNAKVRFHSDEEDEQQPAAAAPAASTPGSYSVPNPGPAQPARPVPAGIPVSREPPTRPSGRGMPVPLGAGVGVRGRQPSTRMGLPSGVRPVRA